MAILDEARRQADEANAAANYRMLQRANELNAARQLGAQETLEGLAARQAAQYAASGNPYAQNAAMYAAEQVPAVTAVPANVQAGNNYYKPAPTGQGLAGWEATRQWLNNTKRND